MKAKMFFTVAALSVFAAFADPNDPQITLNSSVVPPVAQGGNRIVTVDYTLDEPAIVTFDVKTNGVSIGAENLKFAAGDVHKVVAAGSRQLQWNAWKAWPGYKFTDGSVSIEVKAWATNSPPDYMTVKLVGDSPERPGALGEKRYYTGPGQLPDLSFGGVMEKGGVTNNAYKTDYLVMRRIPAAGKTFRMGSPANEPGRYGGSEVLHYVSLTNDFYMSVFEFTAGQFRNITTNFNEFSSWVSAYNSTDICLGVAPLSEVPTRPVDCYQYQSLRGAGKFWPADGHAVSTLSGDNPTLGVMRNALDISTLDMPTEAEWEFACRAGTTSGRYDGSEYNATDDSAFEQLGWVIGNYEPTRDVGLLKPNGYGLYDMYGNVAEWCLDRYVWACATEGSAVVAPVGPVTGTERVIRGAWVNVNNYRQFARSAFRFNREYDYKPTYGYEGKCGYRLVCTF